MPQPVIQVGDIVTVTLQGSGGQVLSQYEVLNIPSVGADYWEFESRDGSEVIAVAAPIAIRKAIS